MGLVDQGSMFGLLIAAISLWLYYTLWIVVTPFLPRDHAVQAFFPDRFYAVAIPITGGIVVLIALAVAYWRLVASKAKKK